MKRAAIILALLASTSLRAQTLLNNLTPVVTPADTDLLPDLQLGALALQKISIGQLREAIQSPATPINPYVCAGFVLGQADSTAVIQTCLNTAASLGVAFDGLNVPLNVSSLFIPSHSRVYNLVVKELANATTTDYSPIVLNNVTDVVLAGAYVDGNRIARTNMVGDGKSQGIALNGRLSSIQILYPTVVNAATDCIRSDAAGVTSASDTDYLQVDVSILNADLQGCGRWGWSGMSLKNFRFTGYAGGNGMNLPGYPASPYTSAGNARTINGALNGPLYAGAFDLEDEGLLGGGFNGVDATILALGNSGGVVVTSDDNLAAFTGFVTRKNLTVRVTADTGNSGAGLAPLAVENNIYSSGALKTFENVNIEANVRNDPIRLDGIDGLIVNAVGKVGTGTAGANSAIVTNSAHMFLNVVSDTSATPQMYIASFPFTAAVTQFSTPAWTTIAAQSLNFGNFLPGGSYRMSYSMLITPSATGVVAGNINFTPTSTVLSDVSVTYTDQTTGAEIVGGTHTPNTAGLNGAAFSFIAVSTDPIIVTEHVTVKPL